MVSTGCRYTGSPLGNLKYEFDFFFVFNIRINVNFCPIFLLETGRVVGCYLCMTHGIYSSTYGGHPTVASLVLLS